MTAGDTDHKLRRFVEKQSLELQATSYVPLYYQLYRLLCLFIRDQDMTKGDRFPSEEAIVNCLKVSRPTVRRAIDELQRRGWLERHRGRGSYLKRSPDLRLGFLRSNLTFMDSSDAKLPHQSEVIVREVRSASKDVVEVFGSEDTSTVFIRRVFSVGDQPLLVCDSHLPADRFANLESQPLIDDSLYVTLQTVYGCRVARSEWSAHADEIIDVSVAELLRIPLFSPVLVLRGIRYDPENRPIEVYYFHLLQGIILQDSVEHSAPAKDVGFQGTQSEVTLRALA